MTHTAALTAPTTTRPRRSTHELRALAEQGARELGPYASADEVAAWHGDPRRLVILVPEHDDFLRPAEARERFASVPEAELIAVDGAKHLWVGESQVSRVLTEIVRTVNPAALPLPTEWPAA